MTAITSAVTRTYDSLLKNYYKKNKNARRDEFRNLYNKNDLIEVDSDAVTKAAKSLRDMEYSSDNGSNVYNNIKAFVTSYNNLLGSTNGTVEYSFSHSAKLLKNMTKKYKDELSEIGIEITSTGKLSINKDTLAGANPKKIKQLLGENSDFTNSVRFYSNKIYKNAHRLNLATPRQTVTAAKADSSAGNAGASDAAASTSTIDLFL